MCIRDRAGDWLGSVIENNVNHRIMVPFTLEGDYLLENIFPEGSYKVTDTIAILPVSYTHLRAHETVLDLVCRLLLEKKNKTPYNP